MTPELPILEVDESMRRDYSMKFIKLFSIGEERTPELIWNNTMRDELQDCLQVQLGIILASSSGTASEVSMGGEQLTFKSAINEFDYEINKKELKIDDIFVKHFNSDIYFRPQNVNNFVDNLFTALRKALQSGSFAEMTAKEFDDVLEITKALRNLI